MPTNRILFLALAVASLAGCASTPPEPAAVTETRQCPRFTQTYAGLPEQGEWRTHISVGDVNEDGLGDIAALPRKGKGPRVFLSDGLGGWTESSNGLEYPDGISCGIGTRLLDFNADDHLDLLVADHCKGVRVFLGDGQGSWTASNRGIPENMQGFNDADAGDLDGDGFIDIVAVSSYQSGFIVLRGHPGPAWEMVWESGLPRVGSGWRLDLVDIDADGRLDIATTFNNTTDDRRVEPPPPAMVWLQTEPFHFEPGQGFPVEGRFFGLAVLPRSDRPVPDLVFSLIGAEASLRRYSSEDGRNWTLTERIDESWFEDRDRSFPNVSVADVDGDGCDDVLTNEGASRRIWLALGDCKGSWYLCPEETLPLVVRPPVGWAVHAGDLNGDGRLDVVAGYGSEKRGNMMAWMQSSGDAAPQQTAKRGDSVAATTATPASAPLAP